MRLKNMMTAMVIVVGILVVYGVGYYRKIFLPVQHHQSEILWTVTSEGSDIDGLISDLRNENRCIADNVMEMMNRFSNDKVLKGTTPGKKYYLVVMRAGEIDPRPRTIDNIVAEAKARGWSEVPPEVAFLLRKKSQEELGSEWVALTTPYLRRSLYWQSWETGAFTLTKKIVENNYQDCLDILYDSNDKNWGSDCLFVFLAPDHEPPASTPPALVRQSGQEPAPATPAAN